MDVASADDEIGSEQEAIRRAYRIGGSDALQNYLGWLHASTIADIKAQAFRGHQGEALPIPHSLFYRLMRHALLLANVDAALQLYEANGVVAPLARREVELPNVRAERTVTRWEFLEARVDRVLPEVSDRAIAVAEYLGSAAGEADPAVSGLTRVRAALAE